MPAARDLAMDLGSIPSRNRLMKELKVGAPKASEVRDALVGEAVGDDLDPDLDEHPNGSAGHPVNLAGPTAITLPVGMETYAAYALRVWLTPSLPGRARTFAQWSAIGSLLLGASGQVAFHLMTAARIDHAPWQITTLVACIPVGVLGMGAALAHLLRNPT
jgi:hypothetical protein